jgi:parallel beta-helix repeat protein
VKFSINYNLLLFLVLIIVIWIQPRNPNFFGIINKNNFDLRNVEKNNIEIEQISNVKLTQIVIDGNDAFFTLARNYNWSGSGVKGEPFIIQNYNFNYNIHTFRFGSLLYIQNTDVYFQIRNCTLTGNLYSMEGIELRNVSNGLIIDNTISLNHGVVGLDLQNTYNIIIANNAIVGGDGSAMSLWNSSNTAIQDNILHNNSGSIGVSHSDNVTIADNYIYDSGGGIVLYDSLYSEIRDNICENNSDYGIRIEEINYSIIAGNYLDKNNGHGIMVLHTYFSEIRNNTCINNNGYGIGLGYSSNNLVTSNTLINNSIVGIPLYHSINNTVSSNYQSYHQSSSTVSSLNEFLCVLVIIGLIWIGRRFRLSH